MRSRSRILDALAGLNPAEVVVPARRKRTGAALARQRRYRRRHDDVAFVVETRRSSRCATISRPRRSTASASPTRRRRGRSRGGRSAPLSRPRIAPRSSATSTRSPPPAGGRARPRCGHAPQNLELVEPSLWRQDHTSLRRGSHRHRRRRAAFAPMAAAAAASGLRPSRRGKRGRVAHWKTNRSANAKLQEQLCGRCADLRAARRHASSRAAAMRAILIALRVSLEQLPVLREALDKHTSPALRELGEQITPLPDLGRSSTTRALADDPPIRHEGRRPDPRRLPRRAG